MSRESVFSRQWRRPAIEPRGRIVRRGRMTEEYEDNGETVKLMQTGGKLIVEIKRTSRARKDFAQFCDSRRVARRPVETNADGGARFGPDGADGADGADDTSDAEVTAWEVIGPGVALAELTGWNGRVHMGARPWVLRWYPVISGVRIPFAASGAGPEKVRPGRPTAFNRPETLSATAAALQSQKRETERNETHETQLYQTARQIAERLGIGPADDRFGWCLKLALILTTPEDAITPEMESEQAACLAKLGIG